MALVLDTSVVLALLNIRDPAHARAVAAVDDVSEDLVLPVGVLFELDYWIRKLLAPEARTLLLEDIEAGGYRVEQLTRADLWRTGRLQQQYADLGLDLVDASVIALCERLGETKVATLDRRDFSVVRPSHCEYLRLLPD